MAGHVVFFFTSLVIARIIKICVGLQQLGILS